ncbi:MAG: UDP-N-acetylglucosamine 2-epimerase (non-hydrolyzing) [Caldiserica bacterium]|nr:UDP-N-acetylglucosamine 2-epimerase (non-hydrolyzing) [Caldisericota bacterium]
MLHNVVSIFGTRPEAIKMAPIVKALESDPRFDSHVLLTGQHMQMLDDVVRMFGIRVWRDLGVMKQRQTLPYLTAALAIQISDALAELQPDMVLVHGDTTTTFMGALAATYAKIPVGHVEAGLRSHQKFSPFPEEVNRMLTDQVSDLCFAPTDEARQNLLRAGIDASRIDVVGNSIVDAVQIALPHLRVPDIMSRVRPDSPIVVMTAHRRENWDTGIAIFSDALVKLSSSHPELTFVFPVHLNPVVRETVFGIASGLPNVVLTDPLPYFDFLYMLEHCVAVLSDSGGIQEESVTLHKPMLLLREVTERPEAVTSGWVKLVGQDGDFIVSSFEQLAASGFAGSHIDGANPYGDGTTAAQIVTRIDDYLNATHRGG